MIHNDIEQGTPEWFELRRGMVTGSCVADAMMKPTQAGYANLLARLAAERMGGPLTMDTYESHAMKLGKDREPLARKLYEFKTDTEVQVVTFVTHDGIEHFGASPDGLIGDDGGLEIKCHQPAAHQDLLLGGSIDGKYIKQIHAEMVCANLRWVDYCSYCPDMREDLQLFITRIERDSDIASEMERKVIAFNMEVDARVRELEALCIK